MACNVTQLANETHRCILANSTTQFSEVQFGLLVAVAIGLPLYVKFEDPIPVGVLIALFGGLLFPALPGQVQVIAWVVLFAGLTIGVFGAAYKGMVR